MALAASLPSVKERRRPRLAAVPVYWHLLSLDAPTVAVLWSWSLARAAHLQAAATNLAVLGLGTWLLYVADRLLDSRPGAARIDLRDRHFFHARHRRALLIACGVALVPLAWLILRMPAAARRDDAILFAASMVYFTLVHLPAVRFRFPRQLAVGVIFALATAVPAWSQPGSDHAEVGALAALFAALCWLNCAAIDSWESLAHPRRPAVTLLALIIAGAACAVMASAGSREAGELCLATAVLASALLLLALDRDYRRSQRLSHDAALSTLALRILADGVLLTPLLLLIRWHR